MGKGTREAVFFLAESSSMNGNMYIIAEVHKALINIETVHVTPSTACSSLEFSAFGQIHGYLGDCWLMWVPHFCPRGLSQPVWWRRTRSPNSCNCMSSEDSVEKTFNLSSAFSLAV